MIAFLVVLLASSFVMGQEDELPPTLFIALFVRNKAHLLRNTLHLLETQDYPKSRIALHVQSDHNEDESVGILQEWLDKQTEYHFKDVTFEHEERRQGDQRVGPLEWTDQRFLHMIEMKHNALQEARSVWADWIFYLDADVFLTNNQTLREMTSKKNLTIVAPMLKSVGLYSNFWAGMTEDFYYKRTEEYKPILERKKVGCFPVPMVHSAVFVNLRNKDSVNLSFTFDDEENYPLDDIIRFALNAAFHDVKLWICNDLQYGYLMLPLEDKQSLDDDKVNLSNLKIEMFAYGHQMAFQEEKTTPKDSLGLDKVYLVNLDRRPDRLSNMVNIFNELRIDYERVNAIDGKKDINEEYLEKNGIKMMPDFSEPYHGRPLTFGEIGCFMSHYNIWKDVINKGYKEIVVFEDDVRFEPFFRQKLDFVRKELVELNLDWDLVFLGRKILHNVHEDWVDNSQMLVHVNYTYWTLGYMMTQRGAQKLIDEKPLGKMVPVDEYLPIMYDRHPNQTWKSHYENRNLVAYSVHPLLLFPTHYTGEDGYISDTEDTEIINHDEL